MISGEGNDVEGVVATVNGLKEGFVSETRDLRIVNCDLSTRRHWRLSADTSGKRKGEGDSGTRGKPRDISLLTVFVLPRPCP